MDKLSFIAAIVPTIGTVIVAVIGVVQVYIVNKDKKEIKSEIKSDIGVVGDKIDKNAVEERKDFIRCQIIALITEDKTDKDFENNQAIHNLYDEYVNLGGNSYIKNKVEAYDELVRKNKK